MTSFSSHFIYLKIVCTTSIIAHIAHWAKPDSRSAFKGKKWNQRLDTILVMVCFKTLQCIRNLSLYHFWASRGSRTEPNFERKIVGKFSKKIPKIGAHNLLMKNLSISIFLYQPSNPYLSLGKKILKKCARNMLKFGSIITCN